MPNINKSNDNNNHCLYQTHAENFRKWVIGLCAGGIAIFLVNNNIVSNNLKKEIIFFLGLAAAFQVLLTFINKSANFYAYYYTDIYDKKDNEGEGFYYKATKWIGSLTHMYWIDLVCDSLSILFIAIAFYKFW